MAETSVHRKAAQIVGKLSPQSRNSLRVLFLSEDGYAALLAALQERALMEAHRNSFLAQVEPIVNRCLRDAEKPWSRLVKVTYPKKGAIKIAPIAPKTPEEGGR